MKFVKQRFRHDPDNGIYGDCARTVIACMLGLDPEDVPHEHRACSGDEQAQLLNTFLAERGILRLQIPVNAPDVDTAFAWGAHYSQGMPYELSGMSRNGTNHVVIALGDGILWDPAIDDSGIVGPCDDGFFWFGFIVRPGVAMIEEAA